MKWNGVNEKILSFMLCNLIVLYLKKMQNIRQYYSFTTKNKMDWRLSHFLYINSGYALISESDSTI